MTTASASKRAASRVRALSQSASSQALQRTESPFRNPTSSCCRSSLPVAWRAVTDGVLEARAGFHLKQLPLGGMSGPRMMGVIHDAVIFLLEQLQGAASCKRHRFRFHRCDDLEEELPLNLSGCARSEVYARYWLACLHRSYSFIESLLKLIVLPPPSTSLLKLEKELSIYLTSWHRSTGSCLKLWGPLMRRTTKSR